MSKKRESSPIPLAVAYVLLFLTVGVGVIRQVGPLELMIRSAVVAGVALVCGRLMVFIWNTIQQQPEGQE